MILLNIIYLILLVILFVLIMPGSIVTIGAPGKFIVFKRTQPVGAIAIHASIFFSIITAVSLFNLIVIKPWTWWMV